MSDEGVEFSGVVKDKLSPEQAEVLSMLTQDYETPRTIALRRGTSLSATYKIIDKLRKKGYLSRGYLGGLKKTTPTRAIQPPKSINNLTPVSSGMIRLHGQEFNIRLIYKSRAYDDLRRRKNIIFLDNNTVRLYKDSIEIYCSEHRSFKAEDEQRATALSFVYWRKIFSRLEHRLKVVIVKAEQTSIKVVNAHYSELGNELAKECNKPEKKFKVRVFATGDGKLWFQIDNSFQLDEAETLHPETGKGDMGEVVKPFFNELRDYPEKPLLLSDIMKVAKEQAEVNKETASGLNAVVTYLKSCLPKKQEDNLESSVRPSYVG